MHTSNKKERWKQRFQNFERAFQLLAEAVSKSDLSVLEKEGMIQRFEYTFELGWKTLKDYMNYEGLETNLPREVIKQAFANGLIENGEAWIDMLEKRNVIAHTYDEKQFDRVVDKITSNYIPAVKQVYELLVQKSNET